MESSGFFLLSTQIRNLSTVELLMNGEYQKGHYNVNL